jgi:prepilin-type N-terminal cleavage/methylation domain-containing protein
MKKNRKGFTLVELIVCIAILAAVSVAGTFGLMSTLKKNRISDYKNDLSEVMKAAYTYTGINGINESGAVKISVLINNGLLDSNIKNKVNAMTCNKFDENDEVKYIKSNNELKFYMEKESDKLYMNDISKDETIITDCN